MRAFLHRYGLALAITWLYVYSFPYFPGIHSANELPRIYLTIAMVDEGTVAIDSGVARWGSTADVSVAHGRHYSNKAPGSSFLAVPAYLAVKAAHGLVGGEPSLAELTWAFRMASGVIPSLLFLLLLWRFLGRFTASDDSRRLAIVGYALGSMAMTYSVLFISHQLAAVCIGTAYILAVWVCEDGCDPRWLLAVGAAAGAAPLVDYQAAFAGVPLAVYLLYQLGRQRRFAHIAYAIVGALVPVGALLLYHQQAFGSPLKTGYDFSQTFAHFHQKGFLGITELRAEAFVGSTVAADNGLFTLCPMLLLMLPGWVIMARRRLYWHLGVTAAVVAIYLLFISSINFWRGGWQLGPRYITAMLPFALVPVTVAVDQAVRRWPTRALALALVVVGVVVYSLSCAQFPHFPETFHNPLYELTFRLMRDDLAPYNLGWALGLRGFASLLPLLVVLALVIGAVALPERARWRSAVPGLALAGGILALYGLFPGGGPAADRAYEWVTTVFPR